MVFFCSARLGNFFFTVIIIVCLTTDLKSIKLISDARKCLLSIVYCPRGKFTLAFEWSFVPMGFGTLVPQVYKAF